MKKGKNVKAKRRLLFISLTIVVLLSFLFVSVYKKFTTIMENKRDSAALTEKYEGLLDEKSQLESEVAKLQNPEYLARRAKEDLLYTNENEKLIRID